jgi:phage terminase large subunit
MMQIYSENKTPDNKIIIMNEGGSRSSKTWDAFHFIIAFCDHNRGRGLEIYALRDTLTNCKDFTLKDFYGVLKVCNLQNEIKISNPQKPDFNIWGNYLHFRGLEDEENAEGYPSDILFFNEILETRKSKVNGLKMRCRLLMIGDWNPKLTRHWVFDLENQPDVYFTHTTYKNNKYLQPSIIREIESYEPTPENIASGTADAFRWKVYGLGIRACNEQSVFRNFELIDEMPTGFDLRVFGMDFGFTNDPSTLVEVIVSGKNLYLREHLYETGLLNADIYQKVKDIVGTDTYVVADSAEPKSIVELRLMGLPVIEATKGPDSVKYGVNKILQYKLHLCRKSVNLQNEFRNYRYQVDKEGNVLNIPVDKDNHLIDPVRYALTKFIR